jgi:hypothetical protein
MSTVRRILLSIFLLSLLPGILPAQQGQPAAETMMMPEEFSNTLKQIWSFLKSETETYLASVVTRGEFETSQEFQRRVTDARQQYVAKTLKYGQDQNLGERVFPVLFKAVLESYDADRQLFSITSKTVVEAPYNIPTIECRIRSNPYVFLADSIRAGYRTSSLYISLPKGHRWQVGRDMARAAKADEANVYFRVKFTVGIAHPDTRDRVVIELDPRELALVNNATQQVFWTVPLK